MRCERPLTRSERPLIGYEAIGGSEGGGDGGCTYWHRREDLPHCVVQDCVPFGAASQKEGEKGEVGRGKGRGGRRAAGGRGGISSTTLLSVLYREILLKVLISN